MKVKEIADKVRAGGRPEMPPRVDPSHAENAAYDTLVRECWAADAAARPSAVEVGARLKQIHLVETTVRAPTAGPIQSLTPAAEPRPRAPLRPMSASRPP